MASREQVLKKRIEDIKAADNQARDGGKFLNSKFKKRVEDLYTRYNSVCQHHDHEDGGGNKKVNNVHPDRCNRNEQPWKIDLRQ